MPIPAIIAALGGAGLLTGLASLSRKRSERPTETRGERPARRGRNMSRTYLSQLIARVRNHMPISQGLIDSAIEEAIQRGRHDIADVIYNSFCQSEVVEEAEEGPGENASTITVSGKSSPIEGIGNKEWSSFVDKLATNEPTFSTDRHFGKYHLRKDRVAELGFSVEQLTDEEMQYAMLVADLTDARDKAKDMIGKHLASTVTIDGKQHPVTLSGLMGLLKAAGVKHAASWLENESDRKQFPSTTNVFLSTNGVF